jgi:hypothetical protein
MRIAVGATLVVLRCWREGVPRGRPTEASRVQGDPRYWVGAAGMAPPSTTLKSKGCCVTLFTP